VQAPIQCRLAGAGAFAQHLESIDISFGGLRICSDEEYRVGAFLRLDIFLLPGAPVTLTAEVIWIEALSKGTSARFDVGLAFVELNSEALRFLMSVLDSEVEWVGARAPESTVEQVPAPADGSVEFALDEPVSEVHPVTSATDNKIVPGSNAPRVCAPPPARGPDDGDRPTPPFDLQAFAHEATARYPERGPELEPARGRPQLRKPVTEWPSIASALLDATDVSTGQRKAQCIGNDPIAEMRECFSSGDYAGALATADLILTAQPNNPIACAFRADCCAALEDVYAFRLGPMDRVPLLASMPKSDSLRILYELMQRGVVAFK